MKPTIHYSDCIVRLPNDTIRNRGKQLAKMLTVPPPVPQTIGRITSGPFIYEGILNTIGRFWTDANFPVFKNGKQIS